MTHLMVLDDERIGDDLTLDSVPLGMARDEDDDDDLEVRPAPPPRPRRGGNVQPGRGNSRSAPPPRRPPPKTRAGGRV